jgi:DNA-binding IclR family transcriptional regulator
MQRSSSNASSLTGYTPSITKAPLAHGSGMPFVQDRTTDGLTPGELRSQANRQQAHLMAIPRWKMFLITLIPAYAGSTALGLVLFALVPHWPFPIINLVLTLLLVVFLTYGALPLAMHLLAGWLNAPQEERLLSQDSGSAGWWSHVLSTWHLLQAGWRTRPGAIAVTNELHHHSSVCVMARAADLFQALADHPEGLSLSQLAYELGLPHTTVRRIVAKLTCPFIVRSSSQIGPGPGLRHLAAELSQSLQQEMRPMMEKLREQLNETVCLASWNGERLLCIDMLPGSHRLQAVSPIGETFPLYCTAPGKAILAALAPERIENLLPPQLEPLTKETITERRSLLAELDQVRLRQIAYEREEWTSGVCAMSVALRESMMRGLVALTVLLPAARFYGHEQKVATVLLEICTQRAGRGVPEW